MRKPACLAPGSRIRIVAPASPPDPVRLRRGIDTLEALGFDVQLAPLVRQVRRRGYLSGPDEERARDVNDAFADPDVDGIVCSNGGFGSQRILPLLDYDAIAANPKPFVGFSDITAIHLAIERHAGFVTFHGPMATPEANDGLDLPSSRDSFVTALTSTAPLGELENPPGCPLLRAVRGGRASGPLIGGNLTLVAASLGTPWEIDTRGKVLFLEDWRTAPYTVDTLLQQLRLAGKFEDAAGIVFGEFLQILPDDREPSLSVGEIVQDATEDLEKPVVYGLAAGHGHECLTLPLGVRCTVDGDDGSFVLDEAATVARGARDTQAKSRSSSS